MTKTDEKKSPGRPKKPGWERLLEIARGLNHEDHLKLQEAGFLIPYMEGMDESDLDKPTWIYRCVHCGKPALHFVGKLFKKLDGETVERPPVTTPIEQLPWVQPFTQAINRYEPSCQHCGQEVVRTGRYFRDKHVWHAEQWAISNEEGMALLSKHTAHSARAAVPYGRIAPRLDAHQPDGSPVGLDSSFDAHAPKNVSDFIPEEGLQKIETLDNAGVLRTPKR